MGALDAKGLQQLVSKIQSQTIKRKTYENVSATWEDDLNGSMFLFKIQPVNKEPWLVKYRISSSLSNNPTSTQLSQVMIGGNQLNIACYNSSNIISNPNTPSADTHTIISCQEQNLLWIGINIKSSFRELHNFVLEIQYFKNCVITMSKTAKKIRDVALESELPLVPKTIPCSKNGIEISSIDSEIIAKLSKVAFSNSYNDLDDKPQLLNILLDENNNELLFFYK